MKQILIVIGVVLGVGVLGFVYRYNIEKAHVVVLPGGGAGQACTQEAKICPDGSAIGRTGPNCSFAACPLPSAELITASSTLDFVLPAGYVLDAHPSDPTILASYSQSSSANATTSSASTISIRAFAITSGQTPAQTMLAHTTFDPSGLQATSTNQFKSVVKGRNTFYEIQIGRFEGQIQTAYYLYLPTQIIRFDITERGVENWMDSKLNVGALPQHQAFLQMLATLVVSNS